ncbi:MAG: MAPEG family protein [Maricaulaceae bacterium]
MDHFLSPILALIIWSLIVWVILYARRLPMLKGADLSDDSAKSPDGAWKNQLPLKVQAPAHNYNHLMEQPTIFYALMFFLFLAEKQNTAGLVLAWAYVVLRIVHSLIQINAGAVMLRFLVFSLSTLCLMGLVVTAFL